MHRIDGSNPGPGQSFVEGDPLSGVPATQVTGRWETAVQEEIAGVVESTGQALDVNNNAQLLAAINLIARGAPLYRQLLINGDFSIWTRLHSTGMTVGQALYTADHWLCSPGTGGSAACTVQKEWLSTSQQELTGNRYGLSWVQSAAGTNPYIEERCENVVTLSGQVAVLSFFIDGVSVSSGTTIAIGTEFRQSFGPAGSADVITAGPTVLVPVAGGMARYQVSITIPSVAGKSYFNNTKHYLAARLKLPSGQTFQLDCGGIQFEAGAIASPQQIRPYDVELRACQRYRFSSYSSDPLTVNTAPGSITDQGSFKQWASGTAGRPLDQRLPVKMRDIGTTHWYSPTSGAIDTIDWEGAARAVTATLSTSFDSPGYPTVAAARAISALEAHVTIDSEIP